MVWVGLAFIADWALGSPIARMRNVWARDSTPPSRMDSLAELIIGVVMGLLGMLSLILGWRL